METPLGKTWIKLYEGKPSETGYYEVKLNDISDAQRITIAKWTGYLFDLEDNRKTHTEFVVAWTGDKI